VYAAYDFNIQPATDNRPYFSQFLLWRNVPRLRELFGQHAFPFLELGSLIIAMTLIQISALAVMLILFPLFRKEKMKQSKFSTFMYFGGLGLGYMFVELVLIQRFILYLGHPMYATAAVIGVMLIFSGVGSLVSSRLAVTSSLLRKTVALVAMMIFAYGIIITPLLHQSIALPALVKAVLLCLLIAPLAFVMGMPFPLGLRNLSGRHDEGIPWAGGINGCLSVIAAPLATLVAVEAGFVAVMICAAVTYALAALSIR
jgi:hypothetical protein